MSKNHKPRERFYLFPGQGGASYHRKQRFILTWTVVVALLVAGLLVAIMWWFSQNQM